MNRCTRRRRDAYALIPGVNRQMTKIKKINGLEAVRRTSPEKLQACGWALVAPYEVPRLVVTGRLDRGPRHKGEARRIGPPLGAATSCGYETEGAMLCSHTPHSRKSHPSATA